MSILTSAHPFYPLQTELCDADWESNISVWDFEDDTWADGNAQTDGVGGGWTIFSGEWENDGEPKWGSGALRAIPQALSSMYSDSVFHINAATNFQVEFWIHASSLVSGSSQFLVDVVREDTISTTQYKFQRVALIENNDGVFVYVQYPGGGISELFPLTRDEHHHIAMNRVDGFVRLFINGSDVINPPRANTFDFQSVKLGLSNSVTGTEGSSISIDGYRFKLNPLTPYAGKFLVPGARFTDCGNPPGGSGGGSGLTRYLFAMTASSPSLHWYYPEDGVFTKIASPSNNLGTGVKSVAAAGNGSLVAVGSSTTPTIDLFVRSGDELVSANATTGLDGSSGVVNSIAWSPNSQYLAAATQASPYVSILRYSSGDNKLTKTAEPDVNPAGSARAIAFSRNGSLVAAGVHRRVRMYAFSPPGGLVETDISAEVAFSIVISLVFTPDGSFVIAARSGSSSKALIVYDTAMNVIGSPYALPGTATPRAIAMSPDGNILAVLSSSSNSVFIYSVDSGSLTHVSTVGVGVGNSDIAFSADGNYLSVVGTSNPYIAILKKTGGTFTAVSGVAALPQAGIATAFMYPSIPGNK